MKAINTTCPECGGTMYEGFLLDITYGSNLPTSWVEEPPEKSFWTGTKVKGKEKLPVQTYRCAACGFLKSYARAREDGK